MTVEDIKVYNNMLGEMRNPFFYKAVSLAVFTEGYRNLKRELYDESMRISENEIEEFAEKAIIISDALREYEELMVELSSELEPKILKYIELESSGSTIDNAFLSYLRNNLSFTYGDLIKHFKDKYSERQLIKYIGNIPIYKRKMIFSKEEIDKKLEEMITDNIIITDQELKNKGKQIEFTERDRFISMPPIYAIFSQSWYPLAEYPEIENIGKEIRTIIGELLSVEVEIGQIGKLLKLIFNENTKDSLTEALNNLSGLVYRYYEQMDENIPDFVIKENGQYKIIVGNREIYESIPM